MRPRLKVIPDALLAVFCMALALPIFAAIFLTSPLQLWRAEQYPMLAVVLLSYYAVPLAIAITILTRHYLFVVMLAVECAGLLAHTLLGAETPELRLLRLLLLGVMVLAGLVVLRKDNLFPFFVKRVRFWRKAPRVSANLPVTMTMGEVSLAVIAENVSATGFCLMGDKSALAIVLAQAQKGTTVLVQARGVPEVPCEIVWFSEVGPMISVGLRALDYERMGLVIEAARGRVANSRIWEWSARLWTRTAVRRASFVLWSASMIGVVGIPACGEETSDLRSSGVSSLDGGVERVFGELPIVAGKIDLLGGGTSASIAREDVRLSLAMSCGEDASSEIEGDGWIERPDAALCHVDLMKVMVRGSSYVASDSQPLRLTFELTDQNQVRIVSPPVSKAYTSRGTLALGQVPALIVDISAQGFVVRDVRDPAPRSGGGSGPTGQTPATSGTGSGSTVPDGPQGSPQGLPPPSPGSPEPPAPGGSGPHPDPMGPSPSPLPSGPEDDPNIAEPSEPKRYPLGDGLTLQDAVRLYAMPEAVEIVAAGTCRPGHCDDCSEGIQAAACVIDTLHRSQRTDEPNLTMADVVRVIQQNRGRSAWIDGIPSFTVTAADLNFETAPAPGSQPRLTMKWKANHTGDAGVSMTTIKVATASIPSGADCTAATNWQEVSDEMDGLDYRTFDLTPGAMCVRLQMFVGTMILQEEIRGPFMISEPEIEFTAAAPVEMAYESRLKLTDAVPFQILHSEVEHRVEVFFSKAGSDSCHGYPRTGWYDLVESESGMSWETYSFEGSSTGFGTFDVCVAYHSPTRTFSRVKRGALIVKVPDVAFTNMPASGIAGERAEIKLSIPSEMQAQVYFRLGSSEGCHGDGSISLGPNWKWVSAGEDSMPSGEGALQSIPWDLPRDPGEYWLCVELPHAGYRVVSEQPFVVRERPASFLNLPWGGGVNQRVVIQLNVPAGHDVSLYYRPDGEDGCHSGGGPLGAPWQRVSAAGATPHKEGTTLSVPWDLPALGSYWLCADVPAATFRTPSPQTIEVYDYAD